ncbi:pH nine-sensitive protein 1 [Balamuthia mandrillaris]
MSQPLWNPPDYGQSRYQPQEDHDGAALHYMGSSGGATTKQAGGFVSGEGSPSYYAPPQQTTQARFQPTGYRDLVFLILFVLHLLIMFGVFGGGMYTTITNKGAVEEDDRIIHNEFEDKGTFLRLLGVSGLCVLLATALSAVWVVLYRYIPKALIVCSLVFTFLLFVSYAISAFAYGSWIAGAILLAFSLFVGLAYLSWRRRIPFAVEMLKTASSLISQFPATVTIAYIALFFQIVWIFFWATTAVMVQQYSQAATGVLSVFLLFSFYWTSQVIKNVVHVTAAGTFATWYFRQSNAMPSNPTLKSFKRASTTSLGSICLGSLIVAVLKTLRAICYSLRRNNSDNIVLVIIGFLAECIIALLDALLRYFNTYAFTQVAIYGKTYVQAAKDTWEMFTSHGLWAIINDNIISSVLTLAAFVSGGVTATFAALITYFVEVDAWIAMTVIGFFIGFVVVLVVLEVVESAVVTIFVCFAEDPQTLQFNHPQLHARLQSTYGDAIHFV